MLTITPEEQKEIDALKLSIAIEKSNTFEYLKTFVDCSDDMIRASGYKSREDAFVKIMKRRMQTIENWIRAHERKWPHN